MQNLTKIGQPILARQRKYGKFKFLTAKHRLGRSLFLLQNRFFSLVLPNLNRSGCTPIVVWNTLVVRLRPRSEHVRL